jgi:hypothetical protein
MKSNQPPFIGTWVLEHLTFGDHNDALSGDLLEEFQSGRSAGWYWRQVLAAIAASYLREARARSLLVVFAALWIMPAQAWWPFAMWPAAHCAEFVFPWPYSTFLGEGVVVFQSLWAGLAAYTLLYSLTKRNFNLEKVGRGFWIGPLAFTLLTIAIQILSHPLGIATSIRGELKLVSCFLSLIAAAWEIRPRVASESKTLDFSGR